jgi:3-carboxy-cis,cis-muconate cycloisomerase
MLARAAMLPDDRVPADRRADRRPATRRRPGDLMDGVVFRDLFGTEEMFEVFNDRALLQSWLDAEAALARAEALCGVIPADAAAEIGRRARADLFDPEEIRRAIRTANHPLVPVVRALAALCDNGAGEYVHWGATTQDIMDTGTVLQLRDAHAILVGRLDELASILARRVREERDTVMAGRTHGQHAVPITLGLKLAVFLDELLRHRERLLQLAPRLLVAELAGAGGTLASLGGAAEEVQNAFARTLDLAVPEVAWHTARDGFAELAAVLAMAAATCERLANEVILLQKTEVAEVFEAHEPGNVGSSTMPQKRNPMTAEGVVAASRLVRRNLVVAIEGMTGQHERDMGAWQAEWIWIRDLCVNADATFVQAGKLAEGLRVDRERMRANLGLTGGLIMAEAVMMEVADVLGRQQAHDLVHSLAMEAFEAQRPFVELLKTDARVAGAVTAERVDSLLAGNDYLGLSTASVERVLARAAETLGAGRS